MPNETNQPMSTVKPFRPEVVSSIKEEVDSTFGGDASEEGKAAAKSKIPPPNYMMVKSTDPTKPERLNANSDEEALAIVQRWVRNNQTSRVFVYRLIGAEVFVPSSEFIPADQIKEKLFPPADQTADASPTDNLPKGTDK